MRIALSLVQIALVASVGLAGAAHAAPVVLSPPSLAGQISSGCASFGGAADATIACDGAALSASYHNGAGAMSGSVDRALPQSISATISYSFEVLGPTSGPVNIDVHLTGSTFATGTTPTFASSTVSSSVTDLFQIPLFSITACSNTDSQSSCRLNGTPSSYAVTQMLTISANTAYKIFMTAQAGEAGGGTAGFTADPDVVFDPSFNATGYSIVFSADATPVPLPASAWLLLSGLLGVMLMSRRSGLATL